MSTYDIVQAVGKHVDFGWHYKCDEVDHINAQLRVVKRL